MLVVMGLIFRACSSRWESDYHKKSFFQVMLAPPLYRKLPHWYHSGLTQIASRFSSVFSTSGIANLRLLPTFSCQDLMPDGKHLTPVSGLHYVLHLFDQTDAALSSPNLSGEVQFLQVKEQVRHHEDRMSYLESKHGQLHQVVDHKIAVDAEFSDSVTNRSEEDWFVLTGQPRLGNLTTHQWQLAARKQVTDIIKMVLNANKSRLDFEVLFVGNPFRHRTTGPTLYNVQMDSVYSAKRIRDLFSSFIRHDRPLQRPPLLKGISIRNKITIETKIRIAIMRQIGAIWQAANPGSSFRVQGFSSRPLLTTLPARSANARPRSYNFIQAVTSLSVQFTDENLTYIFQVVNENHPGKLRSLFIVISDDDRERCLDLVRIKRGQQNPPSQPSGSQPSGSRAPQPSGSSQPSHPVS